MRIIERRQDEDGGVELTCELDAASPADTTCIISSFLTSPSVASFCVSASFGEIGGGGIIADDASELPEFVKQFERYGLDGTDGYIVIGDERVSFFSYDVNKVTLIAPQEVESDVIGILETAESQARGA